jgi:hypothetical protein
LEDNHAGADARRRAVREAGRPGYLIYAPPYTANSAGIWCLYHLCHELNGRGFPSFMVNSYRTAHQCVAPLIGWSEARRLVRRGYTAVYPEVVVGNPLRARSVARWVLNRPGLLGGRRGYDASELVFNYSEVYKAYIRGPIAGMLHMPTIDQSLFFCDDEDLAHRSLECFYVGKSAWKEGVVERSKAFEITRLAPSKSELGKLFRASRVLYCFDNSTILVFEALMCGCPVVIIPDGTQTKADYANLELGMDGIAWGPEELGQVRTNVPRLRGRYEAIKDEFQVQLTQFIAITQHAVESTAARAAA